MNPHTQSSAFAKIAISDETPCSIQKLPLPQFSVEGDWTCAPNCFELIWITRGVGDQWIDLQKTEIRNDRVICLRPGQVHRFKSRHQIEGYLISLDRALIVSLEREVNSLPLVALLQLFSGTNGIILTPEMEPVLRELINQMNLVLISTELPKTDLLNCYIEILITHLNHQWDGSAEKCIRTRNTELTESFLSLLEKNFKTERRVAEYASCLSVTANHLNDAIKK